MIEISAVLILGLMVGSFLSVVIKRLHSGKEGIFFGRSACPKCKHLLSAKNLIPVFSFLLQNGKCEYCKKKISLAYPVIEITTALLFLAIFFRDFNALTFSLNAAFFTVLIFIFFYDLFYKEIHDAVMLPAIAVAFLLSFYFGNTVTAVYGALLGSGFFAIQWLLSKGKWLGSGDIRIGAFMGLMLGLKLTALALAISYFLGSIIGIFLIITKKAGKKTKIPLGPFLATGTVITFFYGERIIDWYLNLMI